MSTHTVKKDGKWSNITNGTRHPETFKTQKEAIKEGRRIAKEHKHEHFIHRGDNGQIREKNSYGNDPRDIKG